MVEGWLYALSNPCYPKNLLKIGRTERTPTERARELYKTGVPLPFKIEYAKKVSNVIEKERILHSILDKYGARVNSNREFFKISLDEIIKFFGLIDGEIWVNLEKKDVCEESNKKFEELTISEASSDEEEEAAALALLSGEPKREQTLSSMILKSRRKNKKKQFNQFGTL